MKKFEIETSSKRQTFIEGWLAEDNELCDLLIELFESNESKHNIGESYTGLNKETKDSIDMVINPIDLKSHDYKPVSNYITHLNKCYWEYLKKYNLDKENVLVMGDDIPDIPIIKLAGIGCCPQDAVPEVKAVSNYISQKNGGKGCVRDVIEQVMKIQNKWI